MPKFVWEITSRGAWAPQLFHGELPREMMAPENRARYVVHDVPKDLLNCASNSADGPLAYLSAWFPPPPPFTGKENSDAE